ncbi:alpha/beta fold hydrolase [Actinomadura luteofluorescens]|uniref:Pimeloyl-ACP methyl ester carboxylesterase n=1 Tax=Actinomadura luteofluorescens TaxID=46163 RepID=A0A7Y9EE81_9ACTN|nr:alpha/beta hydrolase [Actinomadura luteofluorescens]NYD46168.1 pimeloyl-ACP methyl ester carboxylesterase [Actinomadura luteofluorescens]
MTIVADPERLGRIALPDGRVLGWAEWGPEDGAPVLLCPGAATSRRLGFGPDAVHRLGVRLVSADRPGLGASSPSPGRTFADFTTDMRALIASRGLGRPAMVGNSQGAPFALACAVAGLASAVAVVSGADEIAAPEFADALPEELRALVDRVAAEPDDAERFFRGFGADAMWTMVMNGSPASDLDVYGEPVFAAAYRRALDEAFAQGPEGYARDTALAMGRWPFDLSGIDVPVSLWYGEQDTAHSPDNGAALAARIPGARRHTVEGIGGAVLWTHADRILTALTRR